MDSERPPPERHRVRVWTGDAARLQIGRELRPQPKQTGQLDLAPRTWAPRSLGLGETRDADFQTDGNASLGDWSM